MGTGVLGVENMQLQSLQNSENAVVEFTLQGGTTISAKLNTIESDGEHVWPDQRRAHVRFPGSVPNLRRGGSSMLVIG